MIYYNFKNYEEFKEIFGIVEHGNGVKSRKNKILLSLYKDRDFLRLHIRRKSFITTKRLYEHAYERSERIYERSTGADTVNESMRRMKHHNQWYLIKNEYRSRARLFDAYLREYEFLCVTNLMSLKMLLNRFLSDAEFRISGATYPLYLNGRCYFSNAYETDDFEGLCEDGTVNAIRYRNLEKDRVFKMKAGKMFNHIMSCNKILSKMPEQIQRWLSEEFVGDWINYATENLSDKEYELKVNDNFHDIYDSECCEGYDEDDDCFGSCMVDDGQHTFYEQYIKAKAAYLVNCDGMISARCIIYTDVTDQDGKKWRLAERQYSYKSDLAIQRQLVSALIRGGHIDGYKKVGASCHDSRAFVDNEGNSLADRKFFIENTIDYGDTLSYQDSFKWLVKDEHKAYNYEPSTSSRILDLATTSNELEGSEDDHEYDSWSDYHGCWIDNDNCAYIESRNDHFYCDECVEAYFIDSTGVRSNYRNWEFRGDCVEIDNEYYYAGNDAEEYRSYGIEKCPYCEDYYLKSNGVHSDYTGKDYCCEDCAVEDERIEKKSDGWVESDWDGELYEDADSVVKAYEWKYAWINRGFGKKYVETTIHIDTLEGLIEKGMAAYVGDTPYIDQIGFDGEPVHIAAANLMVAA